MSGFDQIEDELTMEEWEEIYGYNSVITTDPVEKGETYNAFGLEHEWEELSTNLYIIRRLEASDYLEDQAQKLDSFVSSEYLLEAFDWEESLQGFEFWEEIYNELISLGTEDVNHPALEEQT